LIDIIASAVKKTDWGKIDIDAAIAQNDRIGKGKI
jgi:hypothetical protein